MFVTSIAKYSSWPVAMSEFQIVVLGKSKVYEELSKHVSKGINGIPAKIKQVENVAEIGEPQIIYLSDGKSSSLEEVLKQTRGKPVMIIAEREGLFKKGANFSFLVNESNNLRFDINNTELEKKRIKISKNLAALANSII